MAGVGGSAHASCRGLSSFENFRDKSMFHGTQATITGRLGCTMILVRATMDRSAIIKPAYIVVLLKLIGCKNLGRHNFQRSVDRLERLVGIFEHQCPAFEIKDDIYIRRSEDQTAQKFPHVRDAESGQHNDAQE